LESYKQIKISLFDNATPEYYGDFAEKGESGKKLLEDELRAEKAGESLLDYLYRIESDLRSR